MIKFYKPLEWLTYLFEWPVGEVPGDVDTPVVDVKLPVLAFRYLGDLFGTTLMVVVLLRFPTRNIHFLFRQILYVLS